MNRHNPFFAVGAFVVLFAWVNVQAMTACWMVPRMMESHASASVSNETPSEDAGHACCAKTSEEPSTSTSASSQDGEALCCSSTGPALASAFDGMAKVQMAGHVLYALDVSALSGVLATSFPLPSDEFRLVVDGPPVYLAVRHFLI